jgi:microsomal dipeptidase-like Zn-dependent dipeptidase
MDTLADIHKITHLLAEKGYTETDINDILNHNWITLLKQTLPETL